MNAVTKFLVVGVAALGLGACQTNEGALTVAGGSRTVTVAPGERGPVSGVGIEAQDIAAMTDQMVRDMLSNRTLSALAARPNPPQVVIDGQFFEVSGTQPIDKNLITDRLRVQLNRASKGQMVFVARNQAALVNQERAMRRDGVVDQGTTGLAQAQASADLRLSGRISTLNARSGTTGAVQRTNYIVFQMIDTERGTIVWENDYEFTRAATDDVVYR